MRNQDNQRALWANSWTSWLEIQNVNRFASWPNYPHCAAIQCHAHCMVVWPNGIVYQVIWATFWHTYVMFWSISLSTRFTVSHSKILSASWDLNDSDDPWSRLPQSRGIAHDSCHLNAIRSRQFERLEPQDCMSESSVLYSLHILHSKQQTHHDSRHWPRLCTGSVSDSH